MLMFSCRTSVGVVHAEPPIETALAFETLKTMIDF